MPKPTPVGAGTAAGALTTVIFYFLSLWPAYAHLPGQVQSAVQTIATALLIYLGGWASVVRSPGQQVRLRLTASPLPMLEEFRPPAPEGTRGSSFHSAG
jgi:hypothetical protein